MAFDEAEDMVIFADRGTMATTPLVQGHVPSLCPDTYEQAREVAPGWDSRYLEKEWRDWVVETPRDADAAFIGFCRKWFDKRGKPA